MARHPNLTEQLSIGVKGLFKRTSRRASARKRRANAGSAAKFKTAKVPAVEQQPPAISKKAVPAATKVVSPPKAASKSGSFWSDLFLVRPWLLVGGLWLTSVLLIAIALSGLSSPGRETVLEPVRRSIDGQPLSAPDAAAASRLVLGGEADTAARRDPAATLPGAPERSMPAWPLLVMVAACAGGCMLVSRQGGVMAEPRRARRRGVAHAASPRPMRSKPSHSRNRRAKRRIGPQRPASQVMAFRSGQQIRHTPPRQPKPSQSVSFAVGGAEAPTSVAVVPSGETSPLDWKEGSLAHKLDVRQTRSINSFL